VRRATIAAAKAAGYIPVKPDRSDQNFNRKVIVPVDSGGKNLVVECRHLAAAYVLAPKKRELLKAFSSLEGVAGHFSPLRARLEDAPYGLLLPKAAGSRHLVYGSDMGHYLTRLAEELDKPGGPQQADVLLISTDHAQALHLERKERKPGHSEAGARYFALSFYDPNRTGNHRRLEFSEPEQLRTLIKRWPRSEYAAVCQNVCVEVPRVEPSRPLSTNGFLLAILGNIQPELDAALLQIDGMTADQLTELVELRTTFGRLSMPCVGMLSQLPGNARSTLRLFEAVARKLDFDAPAIVNLLEARQPDGQTALSDVMRSGLADVVIEFGESLARLDLDANSIAQLLSARKGGNGAPALYLACTRGHISTVSAFGKVIDRFKDKLDTAQRKDLFDGTHNGESAADAARRLGYLGASIALAARRKSHFADSTT
jgi:hypothetical protein